MPSSFRQNVIDPSLDRSKVVPPEAWEDSPEPVPPGTPTGDRREADYRSNPTNPPEGSAPFRGR
jgi:hypothetical protein